MKRRSPEDSVEPLLFDLPLNERSSPERGTELRKREALVPKEGPAASRPTPTPLPPTDQPRLITDDTPALEEPWVAVPTKVGLGERWLAGTADLFIDLLILGLTALVVTQMGITLSFEVWPSFLALGLLFSCVYTVISLAFWGQTPGMVWMGHMARSVTDEPLTFGQTFLRWLGSLLTLALLGLPLLLVFAGGRSMSDRLSDSKTLHLPGAR